MRSHQQPDDALPWEQLREPSGREGDVFGADVGNGEIRGSRICQEIVASEAHALGAGQRHPELARDTGVDEQVRRSGIQ
jgi:hypothetical protein